MTTTRIPCKSENCAAAILPATADKTGGYCMPCQQAMKRREQEEYIRLNRKDINLYENVTDPVEILKIMYTPRQRNVLENYIPYDKSAEQLYRMLSKHDVAKLKAYTAELIGQGRMDQAEEILLSLACFAEVPIAEFLGDLIREQRYYPGILYRQAPAGIRDHLIREIDTDAGSRNHLLLALAWIGDETVVELFHRWRTEPPVWRGELYVAPELYAHEAGWELTEDGQRRDLFYKTSYPFEQGASAPDDAAVLLTESGQGCPWCERPLAVLFDLNLAHPSLEFLRIRGERLKIAACLSCNCYGYMYTDVETDGTFTWSAHNGKPAGVGETGEGGDICGSSAPRSLRLSAEPRGPYYAAVWTLEPAASSQVGGHPAWIQDAEYPDCPECSRAMKFIAQMNGEDVEEYGEGIYYGFLCQPCRIAAVHYQQT
ncbi:DUF1963 domain-containing protein [Paenibacillus lutrae]|uniref:DUF1963 domain-containing protein n=1 Tax=Paenibacillus lutrae TaxID=2078573 RepID=A0A7X3FK85_9BACL|nr:DUF1963 domain-containing protein [Paenibacillus lutrae]MVP01291.1 DUF1963 domain-containing protein [Paenibacillus lutrae]